MKPLRVGVVGCGKIAQMIHLPVLADSEEFEISAVADISAEVVENVGERFGVAERYTSSDELVRSGRVDAVAVLTREHVDVALSAADSGKHVFIEKPLCYDPADGERLVEASRQPGIKMMVGYMKLFDPGFLHGVDVIRSLPEWSYARLHNFAGDRTIYRDLYRIDVETTKPQAQLSRSAEDEVIRAVGADRSSHADVFEMIANVASHDFAVLRTALGSPRGVLYSTLSDNKVLAVLDYGRQRCTFELGADSTYPGWDEALAVYAGNESVTVEFANPFIRYTPTVVRRTTEQDGAAVNAETRVGYQEAFRRQWEHFRECVVNDGEVLSTVAGGQSDVVLAVEIVRRLDVRSEDAER